MRKPSRRIAVSIVAIAATASAVLGIPKASAHVIFDGLYTVGLNNGDTGVSTGDTVHVHAYYDPTKAVLQYNDVNNIVYSFGADAAQLTVTINDLVWKTTAGLSIDTQYLPPSVDDNGAVVAGERMVVQFIAETRANVMPGVIPTTLSTPWSPNVTRNPSDTEWLFFLPEFVARPGVDPSQVYLPRLFTEIDFASLLLQLPSELPNSPIGAAFADTTTGPRFFNFGGASSIPEPATAWLFALGAIALLTARPRR